MRCLGHVRNRNHDGLFVILCDSTARFGGWDEHGDALADEGSTELDLGGLRAFVEEAHGAGSHELHRSDDGTLWLLAPIEDGVRRIPVDHLESAPRVQVIEMGAIDVPSRTLTIALAYPPLNTTTQGDHAGVTHEDGERLDVMEVAEVLVVTREFTADGAQVVALRPMGG